MTSAVEADRAGKSRPSTIPSGKFAGVRIEWLTHDDLIYLRHEFRHADQTVQAEVMRELTRRERAARGGRFVLR
jgi:hypothetical protein